jgi:cell wall-associated NlpC family hydrolase
MIWWGKYVGKPFAPDARGPDTYDCWGLVQAVHRDRLGIDLPSYGEISARDLMAVARQMDGDSAADPWRPVDQPREGDVAIMRGMHGRRIVHVGVMVDARHLLHVERDTHAAVVPVSHVSVAGRIAGYRRHTDAG